MMLELTDTTPCADCPHSRGTHYRTYDSQHVGCVACECGGFMLTPSKPVVTDPVETERLVQKGMTIFRRIVVCKAATDLTTAYLEDPTITLDALKPRMLRLIEALDGV